MFHTFDMEIHKRNCLSFSHATCSAVAASECFEIGRTAYNDQDYYHAVMWMQHALDVERANIDSTLDEVLLLDYLAYSIYLVSQSRDVALVAS